MSNLILAEWFKLRKDPVFQALWMVMIVVAVVFSLLQLNDDKDITGIVLFAKATAGNTYFLKLLLSVLAGFFISSEYANGVMKRTASAGSSRSRIYASKLAVYAPGVGFIALLFPLCNAIVGSLLFGFGSLAEVDATLYLFRTLGFTLLFAVAFASIAAWFAVSLMDNGKTIGVSIVFFLFVDGLANFIGIYVPLVKKMYAYSPFYLFTQSAEYRLDAGDIGLSLVAVLTFVAFALLGMHVFRKQEIK